MLARRETQTNLKPQKMAAGGLELPSTLNAVISSGVGCTSGVRDGERAREDQWPEEQN